MEHGRVIIVWLALVPGYLPSTYTYTAIKAVEEVARTSILFAFAWN